MVLNIQFLNENRSVSVFHRSFVGHSWINGLEKGEEQKEYPTNTKSLTAIQMEAYWENCKWSHIAKD